MRRQLLKVRALPASVETVATHCVQNALGSLRNAVPHASITPTCLPMKFNNGWESVLAVE